MRDDLASWAAAHLVDPHISVVPAVPAAALGRAIATLGVGPDHLIGEEVLALCDESPSGGAFTMGAIVTDARLLVRAEGRTTVVAYPALQSARALEGLVTSGLEVRSGGMLSRWPLATARPLAAFLGAILEAPADARVPEPRALVTPNALDSAGLAGARAQLVSSDRRVALLLDVALHAQQRGELAVDLARDFAARFALADRALAFGRGGHEGWWLGPLGGPDTLVALSQVLGTAVGVADVGAIRTAEFRLSTWGGSISCKLAPSSGFTAFTTEVSGGRPLSETQPDRVRALFDALVPIELRTLARRLVCGWALTPEQLAGVPAATLEIRLGAAGGPVDFVSLFGLPAA